MHRCSDDCSCFHVLIAEKCCDAWCTRQLCALVAKALVALCVGCVSAHTQETMDVCACYVCVQAVENVDFILSTLMCACRGCVCNLSL